jgi:ribonucleoside-diphosphate reductase alpha chain
MKITKITKLQHSCATYDIESPEVHSYIIESKGHKIISHNSSLMQNSTNGIEPIVQLFQFKDDRQGSAAWIAPNAKKYGKFYKSAYDCSNLGIIKCVAAVMKWLCMSASGNHYYNYGNYKDNKLESTDVAFDILMSYKYGWKTLYYAKNKQVVNKDTSLDETVKKTVEEVESGCFGGACSL